MSPCILCRTRDLLDANVVMGDSQKRRIIRLRQPLLVAKPRDRLGTVSGWDGGEHREQAEAGRKDQESCWEIEEANSMDPAGLEEMLEARGAGVLSG